MEEAVNNRMETITKKRGAVLQTMLQSGLPSEFFDTDEKKKKQSSLTRLLDVRKSISLEFSNLNFSEIGWKNLLFW